MDYSIINDDNVAYLTQLPDNSIDAVITDPPYGIEFLGKDWDTNTGAVQCWQQCLRVLKPGGYLLAFSAARTYHQLASNIEQSGFQIRDQIMWLYATGFPKAQSIKGHPGWKTQLKPAHEPIVMARKPVKGAQYKNVDTWGVGALNIDATRIPTDDVRSGGANGMSRLTFGEGDTSNEDSFKSYTPSDEGRFPTNVIGEVEGYQKYFYSPKVTRQERNIGCEERQAKPLFEARHQDAKALGSWADKRDQTHKNNHPTVKPVALMRYLIQLVTPANSHVLDPFCGSGSTGMAATELGHKFTGIELDANYCDIALRRIEAWHKLHDNNYNKLFEERKNENATTT